MRTIEYLLITLLIGALVIYGATTFAKAVSSSLNNSAAAIAHAGR